MSKYFYTVLLGLLTTAFVMAQPPKQAVTFFKNAVTLRDKGMFLESIASFKKAITLDKKYDSAYLELAILYTKVSVPDSGILLLKSALKIKPDFEKGYLTLGNIYRDFKNSPDEAIENYLQAYKIDTSNKVTLYSLAWCYNAKDYSREAIKYGVKALEVDNNYKPAYNELGHAYRKLKAYEECIAQFKKNLAISVNDLPMLYMGFSYMEMNEKEKALQIAEELKSINPKMAEGLKKRVEEKK